MSNLSRGLLLILGFMISISCTQRIEKTKKRDINQELRSYVSGWIGVPYKLGGSDKEGIDCSALTQNIYKQVLKVELPRRVVQQRVEGTRIKKDSLLAGDLVVFKAPLFGRPHIGVYLSDQEFVHASSSKGVMISSLEDYYWNRKYREGRRLIDEHGKSILTD